ncbi:MAG: flagellar L-ring protein precursor FlgH [Oleiphilaceae bacterium]|jgi:flagellar L-ring protein precursor FlgH
MNFILCRLHRNRQLLSVCALSLLIASCQTPVGPEQEVVLDLATNPDVQSIPIPKPKDDEQIKQGDPRFSPVRDRSAEVMRVPTGSLFNQDKYSGFFLQKRQYSVGDMVQVLLEEEISAKKQQILNNDNNTKLNLAPRVKAGFIKVDDEVLSIDHRQSSSFNSSSDSKQSNSLDGTINVFINEILGNGNLVVSGEKWIKLNIGDEYVRVNGELRIEDINSDNTISSTKLGNPIIEYSGNGPAQENQEKSVIATILSIFQ